MRYLSVCSGIEAATVAWHPLGWEPVAFSEIDPFACAVLRHHYPEVPNLGDIARIGAVGPVDLLVGGTPCQSFSVAGLRAGLADPRGNLVLEYLRVLDRARPRWCVWENVPGVLSVDDGRAFGAVLGGLAELGYGFAYRVLDAQYVGVPQRRRRVFVVGHLGDWRRAAAVLLERASLSGHPAPREEAREDVAPCLRGGAASEGSHRKPNGSDEMPLAVAGGLTARYGKGPDSDLTDALIAHSLRADGFDAGEDGTGRGAPPGVAPPDPEAFNWQQGGDTALGMARSGVPPLRAEQTMAVAYQCQGSHVGEMGTLRAGNGNEGGGVPFVVNGNSRVEFAEDHAMPLRADQGSGGCQAIAFSSKDSGLDAGDLSPTLRAMPHDSSHANGGGQVAVAQAMAVRRLTPVECERLQGFPDGYTDVPYRRKPAADRPRYRALGNSMAVPVMAWIGRRIQMVEEVAPC